MFNLDDIKKKTEMEIIFCAYLNIKDKLNLSKYKNIEKKFKFFFVLKLQLLKMCFLFISIITNLLHIMYHYNTRKI